MKDIKGFESDLASIKSTMERSVKFRSLSGMSGVLAGIYALLGSFCAYYLIYFPKAPAGYQFSTLNEMTVLYGLLGIAALVLFLALSTAFWLSTIKAKKTGEKIWNPSGKDLLAQVSIPLITGGFFSIILIYHRYYEFITPACLLFYGLTLVQGSAKTFKELRYLGLIEIILGLLTAAFPEYGLISWTLGFGVMHIVYGSVMYIRYEK